MRRISIIVFLMLFCHCIFAQQEKKEIFNSSYWNGYADKIRLQGKEREEFINSHKKLHSQIPAYISENPPFNPSSQKMIGLPNNVFAGPCVNADFEAGSITGWTATSGFNPGFNPSGCCPNPGGQQIIMSGAGLDPFGAFPVVCPGGSFSLRLGNAVNGGQADRIEQTFLVSPANANFSYKYACVLEDPGHSPSQQPSFQVEMIDTTNALVPCTFFYVAAGQGIPGFSNSPTPGVIYKPWTTVLVDLSPYIGQNITIRFTSFDCSLGGHFGYSYIDGVCQSFVGGGSATVCAGAVQNFCAPSGLASYTWNGPGVSNVVSQCVNATLPGVYTVQSTLFTNCNGPTFTYTLDNQPAPLANAGSNVTVCANNNLVSLTGSITGFSATPVWSGSGDGVFTPSTNLSSTYTPGPADISAGSVILTLSTANNGFCPPATSTIQVSITPSPTVNAGSDQTICATGGAALNGTVAGTPVTGSWTSSGSGSFAPSPAVLNPTYFPSPSDIIAGSVTLNLISTGNQGCIPVSDNVIISFQNPPQANAGFNSTVCANNNAVPLNGSIIGYSANPQWSSNGSGVFTSTSNLTTTYNPSPADIASGSVNISLTTLNNGVCPASTSTIQIIISPAPVVSAGASQTICSNSSAVLNGSVVSQSGTGSWLSSGDGTFVPFQNILTTTYVPGPADIASGIVTLSLTPTANGNCLPVTSTLALSVIQLATVSAGNSQTLCSNNSSVNLTGTVTGGTSSGIWTSNGSGTFSPGPANPTCTYLTNPADIINGAVVFTLSSINNGPCPAVSSTVQVNIVLLATANAGSNQFVCENSGTIALNGNINTGNGFWTSNGSGIYIPGNTSLTTTYSFSPADVNAGSVTFTLSSANNGPCPVVSDSVQVNIKKLAVVNTGVNPSICSTTGSINLNGTITGGSNSGVWSTNGNGFFNPGPSSLSNTYIVAVSDVNAGSVIFTLTSLNNGPCPAVSDTMLMTITQIAAVNAGMNQALCESSKTIGLTGMVSTNNGGWTCSGSGSFIPDNVSMNTTYSISAADVNAGSVTFTLSSSNTGPCPVTRDTVKVLIKKLASVTAGPDKSVCSTNTAVIMNGNVSGGSSTGIWTTNGGGSLNPGNTSLNLNYSIVQADINAGTIVFVLTSQNNGLCPPVSDTALLRIFKNPSIRLSNDTSVCSYQNPLMIKPTVTGDIGALQWTSSGSGFFLSGNASNPILYDFTNDMNQGAVTLSVVTQNNGPCGDVSGFIRIKIRQSPKADFSASTYTANIPNDPVTFTNLSQLASNYNWNFGDGVTSGAISPVHNFQAVGFYNVMLVAQNQYGCSDTAVKQIKVVSDIQFPNAFTPNANGSNGGSFKTNDYSNDVFFPYTAYEGVTGYNLQIFNRWGELIFESKDVLKGWDGYFNGKLCQQDVYVWKAKVDFFDGRTYNKTGSVTLVR